MSSEVLNPKLWNGRTVREVKAWRIEDDSVVHETLLERVVKKCFASGGTQMFVTIFSWAHDCSLSWVSSIRSTTPLYFFNICLTKLLSSLVRLGLPSDIFRVGLWLKCSYICYMFMHYTCPDDPNNVLWSKPRSLSTFPDTRVVSFLWPHIIIILCSQTLSVPVFGVDTNFTPM